MLLQLRVENYAVIDQVAVEFAPGLNLLTGETGAGKSILIDALSLLLGEKASPESVRHGAERALVSCTFDLEHSPAARRISGLLQENGIDADSDQLILRRDIAVNGKGRVFVNNQPATVAVLRSLAPYLATIHAQNQTTLSFDPASRLQLLDVYAGVSTTTVEELYTRQNSIRQRIQDLQRDEQDRLRLVDLWSFQKKEIDSARLEAGEDQRLETEKRVLANAEKLYTAAMNAYEALYEGTVSAASLLHQAEKQLQELARFDESFHSSGSQLSAARVTVEDIAANLRDYAENIDASPERLEEIEDRLALLDRLKRKYGQSLEAVLAYLDEISRKLNEVENRDEALAQLNKDLTTASAEYLAEARSLSRKRRDAAKKLEQLVETEINALAMKSRFHIEITGSEQQAEWNSTGFDQAAYLISTNPGEPLKPVEQIASGGELSRVMLALKASIEEGSAKANAGNGKSRNRSSQRTMIFDEIDTGIGGRAADAVGKKLRSLAAGNQVLCITHLPQIAAFADHHYVIEKKEVSGRTHTSIRRLSIQERTREIARMLSGAKLTETSLKHAEQMLKANA